MHKLKHESIDSKINRIKKLIYGYCNFIKPIIKEKFVCGLVD